MVQSIERPQTRHLRHALALLLIGVGCTAAAHAGPPFQTDDPEPIDYRHTEMYAFTLVDSTGKNAGGPYWKCRRTR